MGEEKKYSDEDYVSVTEISSDKELGCGFIMPFERAIGNCLLRSLGL